MRKVTRQSVRVLVPVAALLGGLLVSRAAWSADPPAAGEPRPAASTGSAAEKLSVTKGSLPQPDGALAYTATAGYMPLTDEQGKPRANLFYTAYTSDRTEPGARRPITFLFNGGPGAASVWLHIGTVGPKRIDIPADGMPPKAPFRVVDNDASWLPATDLVFLDPVNPGYSRAATPDQAKEFFGVNEDVQAAAEFIRRYLTRYQRWGSPVFLAGESYGTTRAAALSDYLQSRTGVSLSGVILMSTVLNFAVISPSEANDLPYALYLPSYAASAWYHHRLGNRWKELDPLLKEAERFAIGDYTVALAKGATLSASERDATARKLSERIGLPQEYVLRSNLRIPPSRFEKELLKPEGGKVIGRFDARITGAPTDPGNDSAEYDPSLSGFYTAYTSAFQEYVRGTLGFASDLSYDVLSPRVHPWNYGPTATNRYLYVGDNLRNAMSENPRLKLLVCQGRFDLATPFFATDYTLSHIEMSPEIRKNVAQRYYLGGHMMYHVKEAREQLYRDVTEFIRGALNPG